MLTLNLEQLRDLIRKSVGVDESIDFSGDIAGITYEELGYDSLARLEIAAQIQHQFGVEISDDMAVDMETPQETLDYVNGHLGTASLPGGSQS